MKKLLILGVLALSPVAITPMAAQADSRIDNVAERIENRIEGDPILRPFNFDTDTVGNTIRIQGQVNTNAQRRRAMNIARNNQSRFRIANFITVRYPRSR